MVVSQLPSSLPAAQAVADVLGRQQDRESAARTYARTLPIVPVRADGMVVEGADGRRYLDCLSGAGTLALGHNHPVVVDAIRRLLDSGAPLHVLDLGTFEKDEFTTTLLDTMPGGPDGWRLHFCGPAGTDAVEAALKLTQIATGRSGVLAFTGGYHGMTAAALAVSANVGVKSPLPRAAIEVTRLPFPYDYRCPFGLGGTLAADLAARYAETMLTDPHSGVVPPAAMILEPVQGEGGTVPAPDGWLREMRRITAAQGIPLIVDEVQTGVGRTGAFWAVEHSGVVPDVLVMSKAIGGSLPLAVIAYREELDTWRPGAHTGTFRGNQLAMVAGSATVRHVRESGLVERAATVGDRMLRELRLLQGQQPAIGDVRGRGLMIGLEIVEPDAAANAIGARPAAPDLARRIRAECLDRGLMVELGGRHDAVVRLLPPLTITDLQVDAVLARLADAVRVASSGYPGSRR
ncbi:diaminobutyrate--2-oxoglutarate transaminase family protein [Micromonospora sp. NBC_01796]|uniref:diaminobutyrate--2-oxoglutarate transaminase family protein n=1 Tax=Micromonospora sp. NBC_01796 TaxID=2975987 RepID=UPI002DD89DDB|nr:diaminobutyrate--2-oxoglutarate transaminase family protein [Micromonospora sp. NBC_01796]WSA85431.1 diaminobutyrate--2-oxoglutarate transaminase family protein [Micromonospora sp. NBC_01796]